MRICFMVHFQAVINKITFWYSLKDIEIKVHYVLKTMANCQNDNPITLKFIMNLMLLIYELDLLRLCLCMCMGSA